jgi:hypothetical protein
MDEEHEATARRYVLDDMPPRVRHLLWAYGTSLETDLPAEIDPSTTLG